MGMGWYWPSDAMVGGQFRSVMFARFVEAPVFGNAQRGVVVSLVYRISSSGAAGGDFQHEVRRFALLVYDVAVAFLVCNRVCAKAMRRSGYLLPAKLRVGLTIR